MTEKPTNERLARDTPDLRTLTAKERQLLTLEVADKLGDGDHKHEAKAFIRERAIEFGVPKVSGRACERLMAAARELLRQSIGKPADELRALSYWRYRDIARDESVPAGVRIRAQERIDKLLGLEAPTKVASTDAQGRDVPAACGEAAFSHILATALERAKQTNKQDQDSSDHGDQV